MSVHRVHGYSPARDPDRQLQLYPCTVCSVRAVAPAPLMLVLRPAVSQLKWALLVVLALVLVAPPPACYSQPTVCGRACESDVQCPDKRGMCTYCMGAAGGRTGPCAPGQRGCRCQADDSSRCGSGGGGPSPANSTQLQLLVIGDSISIGWSPVLFPMLTQFECQHVPTNAGPASKGFGCTAAWLGSVSWDVVLFNFGLHSLDRHRLPNGSSAIVTGEAVSRASLRWGLAYFTSTRVAELLAVVDRKPWRTTRRS